MGRERDVSANELADFSRPVRSGDMENKVRGVKRMFELLGWRVPGNLGYFAVAEFTQTYAKVPTDESIRASDEDPHWLINLRRLPAGRAIFAV